MHPCRYLGHQIVELFTSSRGAAYCVETLGYLGCYVQQRARRHLYRSESSRWQDADMMIGQRLRDKCGGPKRFRRHPDHRLPPPRVTLYHTISIDGRREQH
jgi:hypothetical protein